MPELALDLAHEPPAEPAREPAAPHAPRPPDASERLAFECALLGGRLARFLRSALPADERAIDLGLAFLERRAAAALATLPDPGLLDRTSGPLERPGATVQPLDRLAFGLALSPFEVDLALLAGLAEEHEGYGDVFRALHPQSQPRPTLGLAAQLLAGDDAGRHELRRLVEAGPARRAGLLALDDDGPFFSRSLALAEALWSALHGIDAWPARLAAGRPPEAIVEASGHGLERWLDEPAARRAIDALARGDAITVLVAADDPDVAFERAAALALAAVGPRGAFALDLPQTSPTAAPDPEFERLLALHALARGTVPVLRLPDGDGPGPVPVPRLDDLPLPIVACARAGTALVRGRRPLLALDCDRLAPVDLARMWRGALPALAEHAPLLGARYPVEPATARQVARDLEHLAWAGGRDPRALGLDDVAAAVRGRSGSVVGGGVRRIRPRADFADLVLPPHRLAQLREAVARLLHQETVLDDWRLLAGRAGARGVRALFAGPPGTGKSFSAEVLAGALGVDLLAVDLSRVVSKWIGETERNLAEVFATAEQARAVLLFDEADALFGKRTEVTDAHDRYANLETAYLLARLERFEGLAILSTNLRQNIDPAFTRRLEFVVDFDEPARDERLALWRAHLPATAPLASDVRLAEIADGFPLVGGLIKNAAAAAAFLAAADGEAIARRHLLHAIRREYEKAGKAFPEPIAGIA